LMILPAAGGSPKVLGLELDRNCTQPHFSSDGKNIYFLLEDQGNQHLASISTTGSNLNKNAGIEHVVYDYDIGPGNSIATIASHAQLPSELFSVVAGKSKQISFMNTKLMEGIQLASMERVHYKSKDGTNIEAFLVKPPQFDSSKKYPLILWPHGGPTGQYQDDFDFRSQLFAANGYAVLLVNPRGSTGYGENFAKAIFADWGNKDYEDEMAGVDHVISLGFIDGDKMAVGGWS
jgi:dipeptidyl aminopeptidase/acylaminoacyl peptidase